jgi:hypothetical protein
MAWPDYPEPPGGGRLTPRLHRHGLECPEDDRCGLLGALAGYLKPAMALAARPGQSL